MHAVAFASYIQEIVSLDVNFSQFYDNVFFSEVCTSANSHLDIISGGPWQLPVEPRRSVEGAALISEATTSSIP